MKTYDGLFIFDDTLPEDRLKEAAGRATAEIEKLGGVVMETKPLGRRSFSRLLKKKESGFYVSVTFQLAADKLAPLQARYRLSDEIFRFQLSRLDEKVVAAAAQAAGSQPAASSVEAGSGRAATERT